MKIIHRAARLIGFPVGEPVLTNVEALQLLNQRRYNELGSKLAEERDSLDVWYMGALHWFSLVNFGLGLAGLTGFVISLIYSNEIIICTTIVILGMFTVFIGVRTQLVKDRKKEWDRLTVRAEELQSCPAETR